MLDFVDVVDGDPARKASSSSELSTTGGMGKPGFRSEPIQPYKGVNVQVVLVPCVYSGTYNVCLLYGRGGGGEESRETNFLPLSQLSSAVVVTLVWLEKRESNYELCLIRSSSSPRSTPTTLTHSSVWRERERKVE